MNTTEFICGLMRRNSDHLEFIPTTTITERWVRQGLYIIQRDRHTTPIGYLLHGHVNDDHTLYIHHVCLSLRPAQVQSARHTVSVLVARAAQGNAHTILLRCSSNLDAIDFWNSCGFVPQAITESGAGRATTIVQYEFNLPKNVERLDSGPPRVGLRPKA